MIGKIGHVFDKWCSRPIVRAMMSFCGINLLVVIPVISVVLICTPQVIELEIIGGDDHLAIAISDARMEDGSVNFCSSLELYNYDSSDSRLRLFSGCFPRAFNFNDLAFFIRSDTASNLVLGCVRKKVGPFSKTLSPVEMLAAYHVDGTNSMSLSDCGMLNVSFINGNCQVIPDKSPAWSGWTFVHKGGRSSSCISIIVGSEMMLLMTVLIVAYARRYVLPRHHHMLQSACLAIVMVFFLFYVVPLQSFFANITEFPFTPTQLLLNILPYSALAFVVAFCGLLLVEIVFERIIHFALFAFLVYEYLEVGILSYGAPSFTGDLSYYSNLALTQRDWMILAEVFIFVMIPYSKLRDFFSWMLCALFVMSAAALVDVIMGKRLINNQMDATVMNCALSDVPRMVSYSSNRNILVFVLDSVTSEASKDVLQENIDIAQAFDGFVAFDNNLGAQYRTEIATACIFTGEYYLGNSNKVCMYDFGKKASMRGSVLLDYLDSSLYVYCMGSRTVFSRGYASNCNRRCVAQISLPTIEKPLFWRPYGLLAMSVFNLSLFRMTPFGWKQLMYRWACPPFGFAEEEYVYPYFRAAPVANHEGVFLYCHTWGAHFPHDVSSDGVRRCISSGTSYRAYLCHVKASISELAKTLDAYKEKGIYDCTTILVTADHGSHGRFDTKRINGERESLSPVAFPMLWIKPANSRGQIVFDGTTPTTHANLHKVLRELKDRDLSIDEIAGMLSSEKRVFVMQTLDGQGYDQWVIASDGSVLSFKHVVVP